LFYVFTTIFYYILFDFSFGRSGKVNWKFLAILFALFTLLVVVEMVLFSKAAKLSTEAKERYEKDNKMIYERINSLEYIKAVSGEKYDEKKIDQQLNSTFRQNKKAL
jgi:ABC-type multidrug transport system fused ATPase/permease subunit